MNSDNFYSELRLLENFIKITDLGNFDKIFQQTVDSCRVRRHQPSQTKIDNLKVTHLTVDS